MCDVLCGKMFALLCGFRVQIFMESLKEGEFRDFRENSTKERKRRGGDDRVKNLQKEYVVN